MLKKHELKTEKVIEKYYGLFELEMVNIICRGDYNMDEKKLPLIEEKRLPKDDVNNPKNIDIDKILSNERKELLEKLKKDRRISIALFHSIS